MNYRIAADADGDGIGELVVVNTASVAGDDVISDPVDEVQLSSEVTVSSFGRSSLRTLQGGGVSGPPGTRLEFQAVGFNPFSLAGNIAIFESQVDDTLVGTSAVVVPNFDDPSGLPQTVLTVIPALPPGPATLLLINLSTFSTVGPFDLTVEAAPSLSRPAEEVIVEALDAIVDGLVALDEVAEAEGITLIPGIHIAIPRVAAFKSEIEAIAGNPTPEEAEFLELLAGQFEVFGVADLLPPTGVLRDFRNPWVEYALGVAGMGSLIIGAAVLAPASLLGTVAVGVAAGILGVPSAYLFAQGIRGLANLPKPPNGNGAAGGGNVTGMGGATPSGGSGFGNAIGTLPVGQGPQLRTQQDEFGPVAVKVFVGGQTLPFTGMTDDGGYFFVPVIPEGEAFTAVATDLASNETRTFEGVGAPVGETVLMYFDFFDDDTNGLPTIDFDTNLSSDLELQETELYSFTGTTGQLITLGSQGAADFVDNCAIDLFAPASSSDLAPVFTCSRFYNETGVIELPASGVYTLSVNSQFSPSGFGSGGYTLGLSEIGPPVAIDLSSSPASRSGEQTVLGDRNFFSFTGQAGDLHKVSISLPAGSQFNGELNVRQPGSEPFFERQLLDSDFVQETKPVGVTDPIELPVSGEYIIEIQKGNNGVAPGLGAWEISVFTPDPPAAIAVGDTVNGSISLPGEIDLYSFTATAGQQVAFETTIDTGQETDQVNWRVTAPNGTVVFDEPLFTDPGTFTLAGSGTYTVMVGSDSDPGTGSYQFTLTNVP